MLVLSRKLEESIMIGDNIELTVVDIKGDRVRLGIEAPKDISVQKQEVYEHIQGTIKNLKTKDDTEGNKDNIGGKYYLSNLYSDCFDPIKYRDIVTGGIYLP